MKTYENNRKQVNARKSANGGNSWSKLLKPAAIGLGVYVAAVAFDGARDAYFNTKDALAVRSNLCSWEDTVAESDSSYNRWAREAIQESMDLGARVGITRLEKRLHDANDGEDVVSGETYRTLTCEYS